MTDLTEFTQQFVRGLRSVPRYVESVCLTCAGDCGEQPDDQCLISAWSAYIQGAFEHGYDAYETGKRCATAQLVVQADRERVRMPCEVKGV